MLMEAIKSKRELRPSFKSSNNSIWTNNSTNTSMGTTLVKSLQPPLKKIRKYSHDLTQEHAFLPQQCLRKTIAAHKMPSYL